MKKSYLFAAFVLAAVLVAGFAMAQDDNEVPFDVEYALAVTTAKIMHKPVPAADATISPDADAALGADEFGFDGFRPVANTLYQYGQGASGENSRTLEALIQFMDEHKRGALTFVSLDYAAEGESFSLNKAWMQPVAPMDPRVFVFFVPSSKVSEAGKEIYLDWNTLYSFVLANAVKKNEDAGRGMFYGFVFCMDRVAPDAEFDVIVSRREREDSKRKSIADDTVLDYDGWKVGVIAGRLQLENPGKRFYVNVFYKPGTGTPEKDRETRRIAQFVSADE